MNNKDIKLTLAISAMGERLARLGNALNVISDCAGIAIVVVVQRWQKEHCLIEKYYPNVSFIWAKHLGLSKSRNEALRNISSDYIWFLDDDVEISCADIDNLLELLRNNPEVDFFRVKIGCIEWHDKFFKNYKPVKQVNKLNLLQVSSIEIIARTSFIKGHYIQFNENIGLGTSYQGGEEIHFLLDAWEKGASFRFIDQVLVRHTCIFEQRILANNNIFEIRGATASRFGVLGYLLLARWGLRYLIKEKNLSYIRAMLRGFFRGYSFFK